MKNLEKKSVKVYENLGFEITQVVPVKVQATDENDKPIFRTNKRGESVPKMIRLMTNGILQTKTTYAKTFAVQYDTSLELNEKEQIQKLSDILSKALHYLNALNDKFAKIGLRYSFSKNKETLLKIDSKYKNYTKTTQIRLSGAQLKRLMDASDNSLSELINTLFIGNQFKKKMQTK